MHFAILSILTLSKLPSAIHLEFSNTQIKALKDKLFEIKDDDVRKMSGKELKGLIHVFTSFLEASDVSQPLHTPTDAEIIIINHMTFEEMEDKMHGIQNQVTPMSASALKDLVTRSTQLPSAPQS